MDTVTKANRNIDSLQPITQKACNLFMDECKKRNIPIFITETFRSQERQKYLYSQGRTREGNIITYCDGVKNKSNHQGGYAWDIAVSPPHDLYDTQIIARAGEVAKELGIEWGGTWKQKDTPHFQIDSKWTDINEEKAPNININEIQIIINRTPTKVKAVNIDGNNYIKLRDLECEKIHIGYENGKVVLNIT